MNSHLLKNPEMTVILTKTVGYIKEYNIRLTEM